MKKLATTLALTAVVLNLGIATVIAADTAGEQEIACNTLGGASSIASTATATFEGKTTEFYTGADAELTSIINVDVTDTRGYDATTPGIDGVADNADDTCGLPYKVQIQSAAGLTNGIDVLDLALGAALTSTATDITCLAAICSPADPLVITSATGTNGTAIAGAQDIVNFSEAFGGEIRTAIDTGELLVTKPPAPIEKGTYQGTITFSLL
jgi:hypothetical protein